MNGILRIIISLTLATFLAACQEGVKIPKGPLSANERYQGPSDGGGGDTCNGRVIESFRVDITELPEYKEFVAPVVEKTFPKDTKFANSPFLFSAKMKNWYIIDCKLQDIPKESKGLYLESFQTAIHTSREIFIDSASYSAMSKEERGRLLLHEMVMSFYLMKFSSIDDLCKISANCTPDVLILSKWKIYRPEPYRPLDAEDHQKIRSVTAWLFAQNESLDFNKFNTMLARNDFDKRFTMVGGGKSETTEIDPQVLVRMFKKYNWSQTYPKFCSFDPATNLSQGACHTEISSAIKKHGEKYDGFFVKIKITREKDAKILEDEFVYPLLKEDKKISMTTNRFGSVLNASVFGLTSNWPNSPGVTLEEGMHSRMLLLMLDFTNKEDPEIFQILYTTLVWYAFEDEIVERNGAKYKETYGYTTSLSEENDTLFIENELPFSFKFSLPGKTFLKSGIVGK